MKILILSDIHSNMVALQAVLDVESFDACICAGDVVDYGCDPSEVVDWIRHNTVACVRGNHDHAVGQKVRPRGGPGLRHLAFVTRPLHWELLSDDQLNWLSQLPTSQFVELDGKRFYLVHGTPRDPLEEYLGPKKAEWQHRLENINADFVCVGHTHQPFILKTKTGTTVVNSGSVGQPRNLDPRASYAVYENGTVTLKQVEYAIDDAVASYRAAGLPTDVCDLAAKTLTDGGLRL